MNPSKKLKNYYKINAIIHLLIFIWVLYMTIKGESYFWIFAIIFGLFLVYWIWKVVKKGREEKMKNIKE